MPLLREDEDALAHSEGFLDEDVNGAEIVAFSVEDNLDEGELHVVMQWTLSGTWVSLSCHGKLK